jgi:hypothetical protein
MVARKRQLDARGERIERSHPADHSNFFRSSSLELSWRSLSAKSLAASVVQLQPSIVGDHATRFLTQQLLCVVKDSELISRVISRLCRHSCRLVFLIRAAHHDLDRVVRQWPPQRLGVVPRSAHPHVPLLVDCQGSPGRERRGQSVCANFIVDTGHLPS